MIKTIQLCFTNALTYHSYNPEKNSLSFISLDPVKWEIECCCSNCMVNIPWGHGEFKSACWGKVGIPVNVWRSFRLESDSKLSQSYYPLSRNINLFEIQVDFRYCRWQLSRIFGVQGAVQIKGEVRTPAQLPSPDAESHEIYNTNSLLSHYVLPKLLCVQ